jgi:hypothetical protein
VKKLLLSRPVQGSMNGEMQALDRAKTVIEVPGRLARCRFAQV